MNLGRDSSCFTEGVSDSVKVGNYTMIAADCVFHQPNDNHLVKYNHNCVFTDNCRQPQNGKEIEIGNDVWIGRGTKLLPGVKIGDGAIVGAWTVVSKDVPAYSVMVGSPCKVTRMRFSPEQIKQLLEIQWWNWPPEVVAERRDDMLDIDLFLSKYGK